MSDDRDELEMPLMPLMSPSPLASYPQNNGGKASVVVTVAPRDGSLSAYAATSSLQRPIKDMTSQHHHQQYQHQQQQQHSHPPSSVGSSSDRDGRTAADRKKSSANGGFAIKSPSKSAHSSVSGKTSAQVRCRAAEGGRQNPNSFPRETSLFARWLVSLVVTDTVL